MFCKLDGESCYHEAFEAEKRVFTADNIDNMQSKGRHQNTKAGWE